MAIIGEVLEKYVTDQIKLRQDKLGASNRTTASLKQFNANTAWVKLTSAILVEDTEKFNYDANIGQKYSLFGGTAVNGNVLGGFSAYEEFGTSEQGYRPPPGIFSFETKNKNRGALRESTLNIKAYSREQFRLLDILFLRLGYSVFIEFGNSLYYNNKGELVSAGSEQSLSSMLFDSKNYGHQEKLLQAVEKKRESTGGNYDGIFGRITNFEWNFTSDGVYDIRLTIVSYGDVIENLKGNNTPTEEISEKEKKKKQEKEEDIKEDLDDADTDAEVIDILKNVDAIGRLSYDIKKSLNAAKAVTKGYTILPKNGGPLTYEGVKNYDAVKIHNEGDGEDYYYIRLEGFLRYMWQKQMLKVDSKGKNPIIQLEDFVSNPAPIYKTPYTVSSNPKLCLIKTSLKVNLADGGIQTKEILKSIPSKASFDTAEKDTGELRNVYLNLAALSRFSFELRDSKNKIAQYDLLKKVVETIESCLGGRNTLRIDVDENLNLVILDEHPIPSFQAKQLKAADYKLKLFGINPGTDATTVRDFGIKTAITNELASTITIGAQANGAVKGEDATAFSKWNEGLIDRILPIKTNEDGETKEDRDNEQETQAKIAEKNKNIAQEYSNFIVSQQKFNWDPEKVNTFGNILSDYLNFDESKTAVAQKKATGVLGFLPLNLNFTIDGIAGLRIYQGLVVDSTFLPSNYGDTMQFIITGVTHKIENNRWITSVDTNMVPSQTSTSEGNQALPSPKASATPGTAGAGSSTPVTYPTGAGPVRLRLERQKEVYSPRSSGPSGTGQTLGKLYLIDENGKKGKYYTTVELPWRENENSVSCIPPGTYTFTKSKANNNPGLGDVLRFAGIPFRSGVLLHVGSIHTHTHGCILPGIPSQKDSNSDTIPDNKSTRAAVNQIINAIYPPGVPANTTFSIEVVGIEGKEYVDKRDGRVYQNPPSLEDRRTQQSQQSRGIYIQLTKNLQTIANLQDTLADGKPLLDDPTDGIDENSQEVGRRLRSAFGFSAGSKYASGPKKGQTVGWQNTYKNLISQLTKNHRKLFQDELKRYTDTVIEDKSFFKFRYPAKDGSFKYSTESLTIKSDNF